MAELFSSGQIIDIILVLMVFQGLALGWVYRVYGKVIAPRDYIYNVLPGACLMLALRAALVEAHWLWVAISLLAGLFTHWVELGRRSVTR